MATFQGRSREQRRHVLSSRPHSVPGLAVDPPRPKPTRNSSLRTHNWFVVHNWIFVLAIAVGLACCQYRSFRTVDRLLWGNPSHDRNAHYYYSLKLATDVQLGRVGRLLSDLNEGRIWPPLHGMVAAGVLLVGGRDYRLAILPSLAAWAGTIFLAFLLARRISPPPGRAACSRPGALVTGGRAACSRPGALVTGGRAACSRPGALDQGGSLAGLVAALFVAASPAHRAFATDIMLESLGAFLTLLVLYFYVRVKQAPAGTLWPARLLALALTLSFLEKYNYWLLLVLALAATEALTHPKELLHWIQDRACSIDWPHWLRVQLLHPLNGVIAFFLVVSALVYQHGDRPFNVAGHNLSLYPPHNLIHFAYVALFFRLAGWNRWRVKGGGWRVKTNLSSPSTLHPSPATLHEPLRKAVRWHACFVAVYLLLPKHSSWFLWYLSLSNANPDQVTDLLDGSRTYAGWLVEHYHLGLGTTLLAAGLALVGLLSWRRVRPGGQAVLCLLVLAAVLTITHPNHKSRNLHSWLATEWLAAGLGAAMLIHGCTSRPFVRHGLSALALLGLGWLLLPAAVLPGQAPDGGPRPAAHSTLDLTDAFLDDLAPPHRCTILTAVTIKTAVQWPFLERHGSLDRFEEHWFGWGEPGPENRAGFLRWLQTTECDTIVCIAGEPGVLCGEVGPETLYHAELLGVLREQSVFRLARQQDFPAHRCRVEVWRREDDKVTR